MTPMTAATRSARVQRMLARMKVQAEAALDQLIDEPREDAILTLIQTFLEIRNEALQEFIDAVTYQQIH